VVVAIGEYHRLTRPAVDLASILRGGPKLDAATGEPAGGWAVAGDPVNSVAFSPDGALVAAACGDGTVCLLYPLHVRPANGRPRSRGIPAPCTAWPSARPSRSSPRPARTARSGSGGEAASHEQLATTAMLVTAASEIVAGWCVPATVSRTTPPSADSKVPQIVLPWLVTCR
jgi:hypothetical protein